ncbi:hypothetical protein RHGRI_035184 [Rhododendron griersonianum]|uniref:Uncharacterized protein n=1 Tax=Rhododendron griersonianum TaxID=479676 RepID=A0AAV6I690_9ERIC|nr:hypothetical protein RHGRI_035184 [Rhododendron griersonianum]
MGILKVKGQKYEDGDEGVHSNSSIHGNMGPVYDSYIKHIIGRHTLCSMVRDMSLKLLMPFRELSTVSEEIMLQTLSMKLFSVSFHGSKPTLQRHGLKEKTYSGLCSTKPCDIPASNSAGVFVRRSACHSLHTLSILSADFSGEAKDLLVDVLNDDSMVLRLHALETLRCTGLFDSLKVQETHMHMVGEECQECVCIFSLNGGRLAVLDVLRWTHGKRFSKLKMLTDCLVLVQALHCMERADVFIKSDGSLIHGGATQLSLRKVLSFQLKNSHTEIPILFTRMILAHIRYLLILINILSGLPYSHGETVDRKILNVGEELWKETLPLQMGSRLYLLEGVKSYTSYEVKISYPTSIPSRFSLLLTRGNSSLGQNWKRKLLNTEKLIFKTDNLELSSDETLVENSAQDGMYVLVTVEPEGVVALPNVQERKEVIFNIVCDELLLFIPQHAWWVVILVVLCLGSAAVIPRFLPSYFLRTNRSPQSASQITSKDS